MKYVQKLLSVLLSLSLIMLPGFQAQAALMGNAELFGSVASNVERTQLIETLDRDSARQQLAALGITQEQAMARIAQMTDQEITLLNQQLADMPAGGDAAAFIVLLLIVFIITDAVGATNIFTFIKPAK